MKFLIWILFIVLLIWLMRGKKPAVGTSSRNAKAAGGTETMQQCLHCGVFVPESEAVVATSGTVYCCEEHRLRHAS